MTDSIAQTVLVAGAGFLGEAAAVYFRARGAQVWAMTRRPERAREFEARGLFPVIADLTRGPLPALPPAGLVIVSPAPDAHDETAYRAVYWEGIARLMEALNPSVTRRLIYTSSTSVYGAIQEGILDEAVMPVPDTEKARILLEAECQVLRGTVPAVVLRLCGLYGPGRNRLESARSSRVPDPARYANLIHRDDAVTAIEVLAARGESGQIYLGADDAAGVNVEIDAFVSALRAGQSLRQAAVPQGIGRRFSNARLRSLGWRPQYPTYREGYRAIQELSKGAKR